MSENNHLIMRTILGAVLAFQGAKLLGMLLQDKPDNYILMAVLAIAFIAVGTIFALNSIKSYIKLTKESASEVISYEDLFKFGSELKVKENGKFRLEGKDYLMKDGDICHFRFNK